jgi:hypothetical protein
MRTNNLFQADIPVAGGSDAGNLCVLQHGNFTKTACLWPIRILPQ